VTKEENTNYKKIKYLLFFSIKNNIPSLINRKTLFSKENKLEGLNK